MAPNTTNHAAFRGHQGSPFHHFAACFAAYTKLRVRAPVRTIVEVLIVPLFALALVIGWVLAGRSELDPFAGNFSTATAPAFPERTLVAAVCRNETFGVPHVLPPTSRLALDVIPRVCSNASMAAATTDCFAGTELGDLCVTDSAWPDFAAEFTDFERRRAIPDFDTMAVARVVARAALPNSRRNSRSPLAALANGAVLHFFDTVSTADIKAFLRATTAAFEFIDGATFTSTDAMHRFTRNESHFMTTWCVVDPIAMTPERQQVTFHCNQSGLPEGNLEEPEATGPGLAAHASKLYLASGFMTLQNTLNDFYTARVLRLNTTNTTSNNRTTTIMEYVPMPVLGGPNEQFLKVVGDILIPLILGFAYMFTVSQSTKRVAEEKETHMREAMLMMGLSAPSILSAWFCSELIFQSASATILAIMFVASMADDTHFAVLWLLFWLNAMTVQALAGFLAAFFSRARVAAMATPVLFFMTVIPAISVSSDVPAGAIYGLVWCPAMALKYGVGLIFKYEANGDGLGFGDMNNSRDRVTMGNLLIAVAATNVGYFILMLYVDAVIPRPFGRRKSVFFPITSPIATLYEACCNASASNTDDDLVDARDPSGAYEDDHHHDDHHDEAQREYHRDGVSVRGLQRVFEDSQGTQFKALAGLTLHARPGDVTALLGPNGSGKSTTYNILTGGIRRSAGRATVFGHDVDTDLGSVRTMLAYCPQHNVLWPHLTCRQHLAFVGTSRGFASAEIDARIEEMASDVALTEKLDAEAGGLSGGQKRKLSIAMAFMADAPVVLLDEPTAGCDVAARHSIWHAIRKQSASHGRVIFLSTHFLEEAEELAQRIAIVCRGRLKAQGSPTFLKSRLGAGYDLTVTVVDGTRAAVDAVKAMVHQHIPNAPIEIAAGEIKIAVGRELVGTSLPPLLAALEAAQQQHNHTYDDEAVAEDGAPVAVRDFGIGATTLESIFMAIVEADGAQQEAERLAEDNAGQPPVPRDSVVVLSEGFLQSQGVDASSDDIILGEPHPNAPVAASSSLADPLVAAQEDAGADQEMAEVGAAAADEHNNDNDDDQPLWHEDEVGRGGHLLSQFASLVNKRFIYARRDPRTVCLQSGIPVIATVLAMLFGLIQLEEQGLVPLDMGAALRAFPGEMLLSSSSLTGCVPTAAQLAPHVGPNVIGRVIGIGSNATMPMGAAFALNNELRADFDRHELDRVGAAACDNDVSTTTTTTTIFGNESFYHSAPIALQDYQKAVARALLPNTNTNTSNNASAIRFVPAYVIGSHPLKYTPVEKALHATVFAVVIAIMITIPFSLIPSTYVSFVVREREEGSKQLQLVSGVSVPLYWLSHFAFDLVSFAVTGCLIFCVFLLFQRDEYIGTTPNFEATLSLMAVFGLTAILGAYAASFLFNSHASAQNVTLMGYFIVGFLVTALVFQLEAVNASTESIANTLKFVFRVVPVFALADGMLGLASLERIRVVTNDPTVSPWQWDVVGWDLLYMGLEVPLFVALVVFFERPTSRNSLLYDPSPAPASTVPADEDEDVAAERRRIERGGSSETSEQATTDMVVIRGLRKEYNGGRVVAVNNLSLGIERGSVFGFLGSNGAGKTTTLNVLSATDGSAPTKGQVTVDGHDPITDPRTVHASIGVCPQFDTVFSLLTPIENLELVASLRGVPLLKRRSVVDRIILAVGLETHKSKVTATLSGGNRRKLSVAAALVGGPSLVVLDEPTAGIDTVARRALWGVISRVARQATVVLTTHHLAEVEHLASRAGIMVGGKLKCIGSLQRLKARFGDGFTLNARLRTADDVEDFVSFVKGIAPGAEVRAGGGGGNDPSRPKESRTITMLIPATSIPLSRLFVVLEGAVRNAVHGISDYTVGQASVEDVFLKVVADSHEPTAV